MKFIFIKIFCSIACVVMLFSTLHISHAKQENFKQIDLANIFSGINGCAVFYTPSSNVVEVYNKDLALKQNPPQSTFKIVSTLMGLEQGVIQDERSKMHYDGTKYALAAWNKDLSLKEAFQFSGVWFYTQVVYNISQNNVANFLKKLQYGNEDITQWKGNSANNKPELNGFWLSSSLKISPVEQVQVLAKIFEGKTDIDKKHIAILQNIMHQKIAGQEIYAKTGSNMQGKSWFVGFTTSSAGNEYFAFYVDDAKGGVSGAKDIALKYFSNQ